MSKKNIFGIGILIISIVCFGFLFMENQGKTKSVTNAPNSQTMEEKNEELKIISVHGNYDFKETFNQLNEYADIVAIVKPTQKVTERESDIKKHEDGFLEDFATRTNVNIKEVLKTSDENIKKNQEMIIREPFAIEGEDVHLLNGYIPLQKNETYIVFLKKGLVSGEYLITDINRGRYHITGKENNILKELAEYKDEHEQKGNGHGLEEEKRIQFNEMLNKKYEKEIKRQLKEMKSN